MHDNDFREKYLQQTKLKEMAIDRDNSQMVNKIKEISNRQKDKDHRMREKSKMR